MIAPTLSVRIDLRVIAPERQERHLLTELGWWDFPSGTKVVLVVDGLPWPGVPEAVIRVIAQGQEVEVEADPASIRAWASALGLVERDSTGGA